MVRHSHTVASALSKADLLNVNVEGMSDSNTHVNGLLTRKTVCDPSTANPNASNLFLTAASLLNDLGSVGGPATNAGNSLVVLLCRAGVPYAKKKRTIESPPKPVRSATSDDGDEDEDEDDDEADEEEEEPADPEPPRKKGRISKVCLSPCIPCDECRLISPSSRRRRPILSSWLP